MSSTVVEDILVRIQALPEEDRRLLERRLADLAEAEWRREADLARGQARRAGIDQAAIDRAVADVRYGG